MKVRKNNFIWLFSFADLAFLLLISFTQIPRVQVENVPLPEIPKEREEAQTIQMIPVKVYVLAPISEEREKAPFQLVYQAMDSEEDRPPEYLTDQMLHDRLMALFRSSQTQNPPILWPHPSARTEDMLTAYEFIREIWKGKEVVIAIKPKEIATDPGI